MRRLIAFSGCLLVVGLWNCDREVPTESKRLIRLPSEQLAIYTDALQDARARVLPNLGTGASVQSLARALDDIERAIPRPDAGVDLESALQRANMAITELQADTTLLPDLDVVLLALEQIEITAFGPNTSSPHEASSLGREQ